MASLKELIVTYQANVKPALDALKQFDSKIRSSYNSLKELKNISFNDMINVNSLSNSINQINSKIRTTSQHLLSASSAFRGAAVELSLAMSLPLSMLIKSSISAVTEMQNIEASFSSIMEKFNTGLSIEDATYEEIQFLKQMSNELAVPFKSVTQSYLQYAAASNDSLEDTRKVIKSFLGVGSALGMSTAQVDLMVKALRQMQSKGRIMTEELNGQLGDTMPGALRLFADALGITTVEFIKLMENGKVSSNIIKEVSDVINKKWGSAIDKGTKTLRSAILRVVNSFYDMRIELGKAIDETTNLNKRLNNFSNWLNKVTENFRILNPEGKKIIVFFLLFLATIWPILVALGTMGKILGYILLGFSLLITSVKYLITLFPVLLGILRKVFLVFSANPLSAFIMATIAIIYYWKDIVKLFKQAQEWISKISLGELWDSFKNFSGKIIPELGLGAKNAISSTTTNSPVSNSQKITNNNLTVNIPQGTTSSDSFSIKNMIFSALAEQNRHSYIESGAL